MVSSSKRDLENARYEIAGQFYEWACFLCQQSAEKAVRALYQKSGAEAFGHSVAGLLSRLTYFQGEEDKKIRNIDRAEHSELVGLAKELDKAYIASRYPNSHPEGAPFEAYTEVEARRFVEYAERIFKFCEDLLSII